MKPQRRAVLGGADGGEALEQLAGRGHARVAGHVERARQLGEHAEGGARGRELGRCESSSEMPLPSLPNAPTLASAEMSVSCALFVMLTPPLAQLASAPRPSRLSSASFLSTSRHTPWPVVPRR